jgi:hypothetical protein
MAKRRTKKQRAGIEDILVELLSKTYRRALDRNPRRQMAYRLLMAAKLQDKDVLIDDSLIRAKLAANEAKKTGSFYSSTALVLMALVRNDKRFFIDLGKCLSGEITPDLFDKRDFDMAEIVLFNPKMPARQAVLELVKRGHREITEDNFRNWKKRLLKAKPRLDAVNAVSSHAPDVKARAISAYVSAPKRNKFPPIAVTDNSD